LIPFIRKIFPVLVKNLHVYQNKKGKVIFVAFLVLLLIQPVYAQENSKESIEFLSQDSFEDLSKAYEESKENNTITKSFAEAFLLKAKRENDINKKIEGYNLIVDRLTRIRNHNQALLYLDSIITIKKDEVDFEQPAQSYITKANIYGAQANYTESMDELAKANFYANKNNNIDQQYLIKYFIALLKNNIGEYGESLDILKEVTNYYEIKSLQSENFRRIHIQSLYALGNQFNVLKSPDSSLRYTKEAIRLTLKTKDSFLYDRMVFSSAISHNLKSEFQSSLDSLKRYLVIAKEKGSSTGTKIRAYMHLGDNYYKQGKKETAIKYLKKVDSIAYAENYFFPGIRNNYELIIEYYKGEKDPKLQLFYIDKLLYADSILDKDVTYLSKKINNEYTTPNLIKEKQRIIDSLESEKNYRRILLIALSFLSFGLILLLVWNYRKQKTYKKRFYELLEKTASKKMVFIEDKTVSELVKNIDISQEIVNTIIQKLETFEKEKGYLQMNLSVNSLAKEFDTNSKYFSKIINTYKNKSFTNYINELRTNYVVDELKTNTKFRKYTIKAIANEIGFNTTEAFSKSFYKITGIYPSYYIKQLEKQYITI